MSAFGEQTIEEIQDDIYERLIAVPFLADVKIHNERKGEILDNIIKSLGVFNDRGTGKIGACIIVLSPVASAEFPEAIDSPLNIDLTIRVLENPIFNDHATKGTLLGGLTLARHIYRLFHHFRPVGILNSLIPQTPTIVPVEDPVAPVAFEIRFSSSESNNLSATKVAMPIFDPSGNAGLIETGSPVDITCTCATAGAVMYYTTDGTLPHVGNPNATQYTVPVSLSGNLLFRVGAFKASYYPSDVNMLVSTDNLSQYIAQGGFRRNLQTGEFYLLQE